MKTQEAVSREPGSIYGGSAEGIRSHYDIGNEFWPQVLGATMAYSCALYEAPDEDLDTAQARKIDWHISASGANSARHVLDIGCGWGSIVKVLSQRGQADVIDGITLSDAQADHLHALELPRVNIEVRNWAEFQPKRSYDSIMSVGALEHFANSKQSSSEKVDVYRDFFSRCASWLTPGGRLSLQTIAYGNMTPEQASPFMNDEIFPDSELPYLHEVLDAARGILEVVAVRNDRLHYALTMEAWARNLSMNRELAMAQVGERKFADMLRFFKFAAVGFRMGKQNLLRFAFRPIRSEWAIQGAADWPSKLLA